jgi:hypothetical protein
MLLSDGIQVLRFHYQGRPGVLDWKQGGGVSGQGPSTRHAQRGGDVRIHGAWWQLRWIWRMVEDRWAWWRRRFQQPYRSGSLVGGVSGGRYYLYGYPLQEGYSCVTRLPLRPPPLNGPLVFPLVCAAFIHLIVPFCLANNTQVEIRKTEGAPSLNPTRL